LGKSSSIRANAQKQTLSFLYAKLNFISYFLVFPHQKAPFSPMGMRNGGAGLDLWTQCESKHQIGFLTAWVGGQAGKDGKGE